MVSELLTDLFVGIYLGLLAGIFPSLVAFSIGFGFKYFTDVTVPGLGVVVLGGALAGVSGGLMGLVDPSLAQSATGITAVLVILMASLWAHSQGDKLAAATPRALTLKSLRESRLSADLAERVDSYGQVRIRAIGDVHDIEGYPPLPDDIREQLAGGSWKFPPNLAFSELEGRLEERLTAEYELAEVTVTLDKQGRAQIAAAPSAAGLSRRVPPGKRAVTVDTLLPTGVARGDIVTLRLPTDTVTGPVVSARTTGADGGKESESTREPEAPEDENATPSTPKLPKTTGGEGQVTVALPVEDARQVIRTDFAPMTVHSRGKQREYEVIGVLKRHGNQFRKVTVGDGSVLAGTTIGEAQVRDTHGVAILAVRRPTERLIAPRGETELLADDTLIVVGQRDDIRAFEEVAG